MQHDQDRSPGADDELDVIRHIAEFDRHVSSLSFGEITKSALQFMSERLGIARASIALLRTDGDGFLIFDATMDVKGIESGKIIPHGSASLSETVGERRSIYRPDIRTWSAKNSIDDAFIAHGIFSTVSVPLMSSGACIGTLNAGARGADGIGSAVRQVIELVAPRLAFALEIGIAHQALAQSEERFRDVFETVGDGIVVADHSNRVIVMANSAICRMLGRTPRELVGQTIAALHPPERLEAVVGTFNRMIEGRLDNALEVPMQHADGRVVLADVCARNTTISNRHCVVGVFRDASQRQLREEEHLQLQKLESIRMLAAGLAHDFNNLLTGLVGNVSLAQMQLDASHEAWQLLEEAQDAATRATALTRQLLTFAKGGAPMRDRVDILQVLRDAASLSTTGTNVQCRFKLPHGRFIVAGDAGQLAQVIQNLVRNAVDAMPMGGTVQLDVAHCEEEHDVGICLEIRDHGHGIAPGVIDKIFVPFFTTKERHSGLGLAVAYSIVQNHSGSIRVSSQIGVGTTIRVFLPIVEESDVPPEAATAPRSEPGRILVMDDETIVLHVAERALHRGGFSTATATNGRDAVAMYRAAMESGEPFDAVVLDLTIPGGMGGREAAKQILSIDPNARLMVSSGYSEDSAMAEYQKHGFSSVLPKPYGATQLCEAVQAMIARRH